MARGRDESKHPSRQVGRTNFYGLSEGRGGQGPMATVTWEGGDTEARPLSELMHADEASKMYGRKVSKSYLKSADKKHNEANMFSTNDVQVMRNL